MYIWLKTVNNYFSTIFLINHKSSYFTSSRKYHCSLSARWTFTTCIFIDRHFSVYYKERKRAPFQIVYTYIYRAKRCTHLAQKTSNIGVNMYRFSALPPRATYSVYFISMVKTLNGEKHSKISGSHY